MLLCGSSCVHSMHNHGLSDTSKCGFSIKGKFNMFFCILIWHKRPLASTRMHRALHTVLQALLSELVPKWRFYNLCTLEKVLSSAALKTKVVLYSGLSISASLMSASIYIKCSLFHFTIGRVKVFRMNITAIISTEPQFQLNVKVSVPILVYTSPVQLEILLPEQLVYL